MENSDAAIKTENVQKEQNLICVGCNEVWKGVYEPGKTVCPVCGLASDVRIEGQETSNVTGTEKEKKRNWFTCISCEGVRWSVEYGDKCPICGQQGKVVK